MAELNVRNRTLARMEDERVTLVAWWRAIDRVGLATHGYGEMD